MIEFAQPNQGPSSNGEWIDIGGGRRGFYARPQGAGPSPAILIYIEAYGVNAHFKRLAERFAAAGFAALVPDLYEGAVYEYSDMPIAVKHMKRMNDDQVMAQSAAALDVLAARPEVIGSAIGVTGFCMGGRYTFLASAVLASRFKAAVAFYGGGIGPVTDFFGRKPPLDRAPELRAPMLLWYGADDQFILPEEHARIAEALGRARKQYTMTVFAGATHGFFCEDRDSYNRDAAERSWRATTAFFREYLTA
jgi:carboxymethylenebutenolidase